MRLTLTSKAMEPSIMPCADGGICVLALQLLRPIAAHEISLQGAGTYAGYYALGTLKQHPQHSDLKWKKPGEPGF